jgi:uroporphyrinogen-III synthase
VPSAPLPLAGRRIAVTRAGGAEDPLARALLELGAEVLDAPSIAFADPESWDELDRALRVIEEFGWLAFASVTAVERTLGRARVLGVPEDGLRRPRLAAVGKATARSIGALLREPDLVSSVASGAALAAELGPRARGQRVLVPRAADGRPELVDGLAAAGAEVMAPVAYRTLPASPEAIAPLAAALREGTVDAVLFASPSAVRSVVAALGPAKSLLPGVTVAAIGPTTAAQLQTLDVPVHVQPVTATVLDLAHALADQLGPA